MKFYSCNMWYIYLVFGAHLFVGFTLSDISEESAVIYNLEKPANPFIGRTEELSQLSMMHVEHKYVIITGIEGVGKSEICRKYAEIIKNGGTTNIIWIDSNSLSSVVHHLLDLATQLGIFHRDLSITPQIRKIMRTLKGQKTVFIFDGANIDNIILHNIRKFTDASHFTSVLVTSREILWNDTDFNTIKLEPFTKYNAETYLRLMLKKELNTTTSDNNIETLARIAKNIPSELNKIISNMVSQNKEHQNQEYTVDDYLDHKINFDDTEIELALKEKLTTTVKPSYQLYPLVPHKEEEEVEESTS